MPDGGPNPSGWRVDASLHCAVWPVVVDGRPDLELHVESMLGEFGLMFEGDLVDLEVGGSVEDLLFAQ